MAHNGTENIIEDYCKRPGCYGKVFIYRKGDQMEGRCDKCGALHEAHWNILIGMWVISIHLGW